MLIAPAKPDVFRYNIGIRSLASGVTLLITHRGQDGSLKETLTKTYPAVYFAQLAATDLLGAPLAANDTLAFNVTAGSAIIYGAATDNRTQDPSVQVAHRLGAGLPSQSILPVIGSTQGTFGSFFKTEMQLHNPWTSPVTGSITFHAEGKTAAASDPVSTFSIAPGQTQDIPDVLSAMNQTGLGSADLSVNGPNAPVSIVRIFNDGGSAGTTGMTIEPVAIAGALAAGDTGALIAPADVTNFRFNVGIRTLSAGATMQLMVRGQDGTLKETVAKSYPPNTFVQVQALELLGVPLAANDTISFVINSGSAVIYGATTDNRTQDPSYQAAKKTF